MASAAPEFQPEVGSMAPSAPPAHWDTAVTGEHSEEGLQPMQIEDGVPVAVAKTVSGFPLPFVGVALLAVLVVVGAVVAVLNAGNAGSPVEHTGSPVEHTCSPVEHTWTPTSRDELWHAIRGPSEVYYVVLHVIDHAEGFQFSNEPDARAQFAVWDGFQLTAGYSGEYAQRLYRGTTVLDLYWGTGQGRSRMGQSDWQMLDDWVQDQQAMRGPISSWDVSRVTDMSDMFRGLRMSDLQMWGPGGDICAWDVSQVTNMRNMFYNTDFGEEHVLNGDIGSWDVSQVTDMTRMFYHASHFNQNIGDWNVAQVTSMQSMFESAHAFDQNIGNWNVAQVTYMNKMFLLASAFNQNIGSWNVAQVQDMRQMFQNSGFSGDLSSWHIADGCRTSAMLCYTRGAICPRGAYCFRPGQVTTYDCTHLLG